MTPERNRTDALTVLGLEPIIVIGSLFVVAGAVEHTPWVQHFTHYLAQSSEPGVIEAVAYLLTAGISADGSAAMLAPTRPARASPVNTGANSSVTVFSTRVPTKYSGTAPVNE